MALKSPFAILLHTTALSIMAYGWNALGKIEISKWIEKQKGGHLQFLTIQGLILAACTMFVSLASDLFPTVTALRGFKRVLLMISLPVACAVSMIYWTLIMLFPFLILQSDPADPVPSLPFIPLPVDISLHAAPAITLVVDFMVLERKFSPNPARWGAAVLISIYAVWYGSWVEYLAQFNNVFPYPFLTDNPFEIRVVIYIGASIMGLCSFWLINALHP